MNWDVEVSGVVTSVLSMRCIVPRLGEVMQVSMKSEPLRDAGHDCRRGARAKRSSGHFQRPRT